MMERTAYKYEHLIYAQADDGVFLRQCQALEENIADLVKGELIEDLDYDRQLYNLHGAEVVVENDTMVNGVFVRSDVNLLPYFQHRQERKVA